MLIFTANYARILHYFSNFRIADCWMFKHKRGFFQFTVCNFLDCMDWADIRIEERLQEITGIDFKFGN